MEKSPGVQFGQSYPEQAPPPLWHPRTSVAESRQTLLLTLFYPASIEWSARIGRRIQGCEVKVRLYLGMGSLKAATTLS